MIRLWPALLLFLLSGCASLAERDRLAQEQRFYYLPWTAGDSYRCIQSGPGTFSHQGREEFAVDFSIPEGTPLLAARDGLVTAVREDSDRGGATREFATQANYVHILHQDGTRAVYFHLRHESARVKPGDRVRRGDLIANSGSTGWSTTPHLHFAVERRDPGEKTWSSIPFAFIEVTDSGVPRFLGRYRSQNQPTRIGGFESSGRLSRPEP